MPSISSLISNLQAQYPILHFVAGDDFRWSPAEATIFYNPDVTSGQPQLLHEVGHALLGHTSYQRDVELLALETDAWEKAEALAIPLAVTIDEDLKQDHLDTYRDWLHARSTCPACAANGYQDSATTYRCPACQHRWRVNEARLCGLKRYSL